MRTSTGLHVAFAHVEVKRHRKMHLIDGIFSHVQGGAKKQLAEPKLDSGSADRDPGSY